VWLFEERTFYMDLPKGLPWKEQLTPSLT